MEGSGSLNEKLKTFLFTCRITPQSTTGISPTELLMKKKLNSKLNIRKPGAQLSKNIFFPNVARQFKEVDEVWIRNLSIGNKWIPGTILCLTGPVSYKMLAEKGIVKRHVDHLQKKKALQKM